MLHEQFTAPCTYSCREKVDVGNHSCTCMLQYHNLICYRWIILFSHPKDFTPVCTSELSKIAVWEPYFSKRNTKFLAHSCDNLKEHLAWVKDIICYCQHLPSNDLPFPIMADENGDLARLLDLFDGTTNENNKFFTSRPLYIIDLQHKIRFLIRYPVTTGRNPK